jgi:CDGSH-type Zn-finger protein
MRPGVTVGDMADPRVISVSPDGPYGVPASMPLVRIRPVDTDGDGRPDAWDVHEELDAAPHGDEDAMVWLCRCGQSLTKPFCDGSHEAGFAGAQTAPESGYRDRATVMHGRDVVVGDDRTICAHAGFCAARGTNVWAMVEHTDDLDVRARMEAMIDRCPSGALTHRPSDHAPDDEPDLPQQIGIVDNGPYHVTGAVRVERSDGRPMEVRHRIALCRCGASAIKPLCDGSHTRIGFTDE